MRRRALRLGLLFALAGAGPACAQGIPRSQRASVSQTVGHTEITIRYRRPVARGRTLFGDVVAWGRTWTPGADTATTIRLSTAVRVNGDSLPAGMYSIWMVPDSAAAWTVIFSRAQPVFHTPYPGEDYDQLRLRVLPRRGEHMETLAFYFPTVDGTSATLAMHWGTTVVPISITAP